MQPPVEFADRLYREFDGRLRCRWSNSRCEWQIEYKIAPGQVPGMVMPRESQDDSLIRAMDGYALVCSIQPGDRMPCPRCGLTLSVPVFKFGQTRCDYCTVHGHKAVVSAAYFPLESSQLIEHLRKIDPTRTWRDDLVAQLDRANDKKRADAERRFENHSEAVLKDGWNQMFQVQQVGYTGKEFKPNV